MQGATPGYWVLGETDHETSVFYTPQLSSQVVCFRPTNSSAVMGVPRLGPDLRTPEGTVPGQVVSPPGLSAPCPPQYIMG